AVVAYALSPLDLVPDFIPVLGYLDDLLLVPLGLALALRLIPAPVVAECRREAAARLAAGSGRPRSRVGRPPSSRSGSCWRAWPPGSSCARPEPSGDAPAGPVADPPRAPGTGARTRAEGGRPGRTVTPSAPVPSLAGGRRAVAPSSDRWP